MDNMRPITELAAEDIQNIKLIIFDCDGVTVKKGTEIEETETTLVIRTSTLSDSMLGKLERLKKFYHLNFSSGRSLLYLERMYGKILWNNASLTGENGIFTLINGRVIQHEFFSLKDLNIIRNIKSEIRDLARTEKKIRGFEPKQFLITVHCWQEVPEIPMILKKFDQEERYYCWWNEEAYDIGLKTLTKGSGIKNICDLLGVAIKNTIAIGNGPNDKGMVEVAGIGITTEPKLLKADFYTTGLQYLGGEELVDKLIELKNVN